MWVCLIFHLHVVSPKFYPLNCTKGDTPYNICKDSWPCILSVHWLISYFPNIKRITLLLRGSFGTASLENTFVHKCF